MTVTFIFAVDTERRLVILGDGTQHRVDFWVNCQRCECDVADAAYAVFKIEDEYYCADMRVLNAPRIKH